jgi:hypothetical protein
MAVLGVLAAMAGVEALACGPFFPVEVLSRDEAALVEAPAASFLAEIDRFTKPSALVARLPDEAGERLRRGRQPEQEDYVRQTTAADLEDLRIALSANGMNDADVTRSLAGYTAARQILCDALLRQEQWRRMMQIRADYERWKCAVPDWYLRQWADEKLDPKRTPGFPPFPMLPDAIPAEFSLYLQGAHAFHGGESVVAQGCWREILALPAEQRRFRSTWAAFMLGKAAMTVAPEEARRRFRETRDLAGEGFSDSLGLAVSSLGWEARVALDRGEYAAAIALYHAQHEAGDPTAVNSLRLAVESVLGLEKPEALLFLARDPLARRVVAAYLLSQGGNYAKAPAWLAAVETESVDALAEADRLAWAAYQVGEFAMAERWLRIADPESLMARWLRAKLALRRGATVEAAAELAEVVRHLPLMTGEDEREAGESALAELPMPRAVRGELGALLLSRGDYGQALTTLLYGGFWQDAAYIAERVLTPGELLACVEVLCPVPQDDKTDEVSENHRHLRHLLARRLARAGRLDEARPYCPDDVQPYLDEYVAAMKAAHDPDAAERRRAAGFWQAATLARHRGDQLFGFELAPDWLVWHGSFGLGPGVEAGRAVATGRLDGSSPDERERLSRHRPAINRRFHYRYRAADLAEQAIRLMPDDDDLTAQMLWVAGSWLKYRDPPEAERFYQDLVRRCPRTDLGRAAKAAHWFPKMEIDEEQLLRELLRGCPQDPRG